MNKDSTTDSKKPEAGEDFSTDYKELKKTIEQLQGDLSKLVSRTVSAGRSGVAALRSQAGGAIGDVGEKYSESVEKLGDSIADHPLTAAAIAVAVGFVLGKLFTRR